MPQGLGEVENKLNEILNSENNKEHDIEGKEQIDIENIDTHDLVNLKY